MKKRVMATLRHSAVKSIPASPVLVAVLCLATVVATSCTGNSRTSPEVLQAKIDSVKRLEEIRLLRLQGIKLDQTQRNPARAFFDSLAVQPLPLTYSDEYVRTIPNFTPVPEDIQQLYGIGALNDPKALALPNHGVRMVLVSADEGEADRTLWLFLLGTDYLPLDQLRLYAHQNKKAVKRVGEKDSSSYFSITSDGQICVETYTEDYKRKNVRLFLADNNGHFIEL